MAEAFISRLPRVGRGILFKADQHCPICIEEYGTHPSTSGTIERAVRLPCNYVVGSECISIWLTPIRGQRSNNTCSICWQVLFEIEQPRMRADQEFTEHMEIHFELGRDITILARHFDLTTDVSLMAAYIANGFHDLGPMGDHSVVAVAAASLYMASHATGDPRSRHAVSRAIAIAGLGNVGADVLSQTYTWLYQDRRVLLHEPLLRRITSWTLATVDEVLPLPET